MANWSPLRERLRPVDHELTIDWADLDALVGGLPRSAYEHLAFWSGDRSAWNGFRTRAVRVGRSVTFTRSGPADPPRRPTKETTQPSSLRDGPDVVLVGCVKSKLDHVASAQDLYTSPLFRKARSYAEQSGKPWLVLSAEHGLVRPEERLAPYDLQLSSTSVTYRRTWAAGVLDRLTEEIGSLQGRVVEVHAGAAYTEALESGLSAAGAVLVDPLHGLRMGERLGWYRAPGPDDPSAKPSTPSADVDQLVAQLEDRSQARSPKDLDRALLSVPGLYCWFVDAAGAAQLQTGLGHPVSEGLIYAGLAGATRERSGRESSNTLWSRITGMHLGKRHSFSTFRRSLGAVLAERNEADDIDEPRLTAWMHEHLTVVALPVADAATLGAIETSVLERLNPPLNLAKRPKTPLRARLSALRKKYATSR